MELEPTGNGTLLRMTHSGVPEDMREEIEMGWKEHYWDPLASYLARDVGE